MTKVQKIIKTIDRINGTFTVQDVLAMSRLGNDKAATKTVSSALIGLSDRGVIKIVGKESNRNIYAVPDGKTAGDLFTEFFSRTKPRRFGEQSKSFMLEHPMIPFPLGEVRMKPAEQRYFAA